MGYTVGFAVVIMFLSDKNGALSSAIFLLHR
jgi:hypothetical protein